MRLRTVTVILATLGVLMGSLAATSSSAQPAPGRTYLALGDSLSASLQPNGDMHSGYAEQILQLEQAGMPDLRLDKLGCPGERSSTMDVAKKRCPYAEGSQLAQAVSVLEHRDVAFVTLQIGSNDTFHCFNFHANAFDEACLDALLPKISARITSIVGTLRAAAGPDVPIVGATYHDPVIFLWTIPGIDHDIVVANSGAWAKFDNMLEQTYAALGVPVADVGTAFSVTDFGTIVHVRGVGDVPIDVARACEWTYECTEKFGYDPHPNTIGYAAMTRAWEAALATVLPV
jgi:lysophospholipase L1-like esterase